MNIDQISDQISNDLDRLETLQKSLLKSNRISLALFVLVALLGFVSAAMAITDAKMNHDCDQDCGPLEGELWRGECYCIENGEPVRSDR